MTTIAFSMEDEQAAQLRDRAALLGVAPEAFVLKAVQGVLTVSRAEESLDDITSRVFARRKSAYEKLAEGAP